MGAALGRRLNGSRHDDAKARKRETRRYVWISEVVAGRGGTGRIPPRPATHLRQSKSPERSPRRKSVQCFRVKCRAGPRRSFESRIAMPSGTSATSTQLAESHRLLLRQASDELLRVNVLPFSLIFRNRLSVFGVRSTRWPHPAPRPGGDHVFGRRSSADSIAAARAWIRRADASSFRAFSQLWSKRCRWKRIRSVLWMISS